jgi:hypothetical protein
MQDFIRQKNIENLLKQLASEQLDAAQRRFAERMLAEELAKQEAPCIPRFKEKGDPGGSSA